MTTTHAITHLTRRALTLTLLAALGGCYLLDPAPPVRPGATEDFDVVVAKIKEIDGVGPDSSFLHTDGISEGSYVTAAVEVENGYDPVQLLDAVLKELYWFGEYAPTPVESFAFTEDGEQYGLQGKLRENAGGEFLASEDMQERYGP